MDKKFTEIKAEYDKFYKSIWSKGKTPMRDTEVGFWELLHVMMYLNCLKNLI